MHKLELSPDVHPVTIVPSIVLSEASFYGDVSMKRSRYGSRRDVLTSLTAAGSESLVALGVASSFPVSAARPLTAGAGAAGADFPICKLPAASLTVDAAPHPNAECTSCTPKVATCKRVKSRLSTANQLELVEDSMFFFCSEPGQAVMEGLRTVP